MPSRLSSAALSGINAVPVDIEVDVLKGLPSYTVVGLGDTAVKESKERLTAAITNLGYQPPRKKTIVSLAPASFKKEGSLYDLPITVAYLIASQQIEIPPGVSRDLNDKTWFVGELGLDGTIRPVRGLLPIMLAARKHGIKQLFVPRANAAEASAVADELTVYAVASLPELLSHLTNPDQSTLQPIEPRLADQGFLAPEIDFIDIKGQELAKRALLIAASAAHNVLLVGPPGSGKTLLARALAGILPPLTREESYAVTSLYSVAGLLEENQGLMHRRPFRSPHHGASSVALVGGGQNPKPGEVSLAHSGVLFLDELPEFSRHVLDQLRQPIEDGYISVARAAFAIRYPARSILVGAMNPCKCGFLGSIRKECQCPHGDIIRYQRKVSGPLLDRFDIHVMVNDTPVKELLADMDAKVPAVGEIDNANKFTSQSIAKVAIDTRNIQIKRQGKTNSELNVRDIKKYCKVDIMSKKLLQQAEDKFHLSSRGVHRVLKVARTIADLEEKNAISPHHLAEALQYREQLKAALPDFA